MNGFNLHCCDICYEVMMIYPSRARANSVTVICCLPPNHRLRRQWEEAATIAYSRQSQRHPQSVPEHVKFNARMSHTEGTSVPDSPVS